MVPRVLGWIDRRDLARRRAVELVRSPLRRSRPEAPSLLNRAELRELRAHPDAVPELEAEWARRRGEQPWAPARLVETSRRKILRRVTLLAIFSSVAISSMGLAAYRWLVERGLRDRNMGRFALELRAFDWDEDRLQVIPVFADSLPQLHWQLREPDEDDPESAGRPVAGYLLVRRSATVAPDRAARIEHVEARGGKAFLVIDGRGQGGDDCAPSIIPLHQLPGYLQRDREEAIRLSIPTCRASRAGMVEIPAGEFWRGGLGVPPASPLAGDDVLPEQAVSLRAFRIDRTEVTNAAFRVLAAMRDVTDITMPSYPKALPGADGDRYPVAGVTWLQARAYCRFLGKELPTSDEWQKALRGGPTLPDGRPNENPRRNLPWGAPRSPAPANLAGAANGPSPVGTWKEDASPYQVLDLAGNVQEWTDSVASEGTRITRGGNWDETTPDKLLYFMAFENERAMTKQSFTLGMRCAVREEDITRASAHQTTLRR